MAAQLISPGAMFGLTASTIYSVYSPEPNSCTYVLLPCCCKWSSIVVQAGLLLGLHLENGLVEIFMAHNCAVSPECQHASFNAHGFQLRSIEVVCGAPQLIEVHIGRHVHLSAVDLQNLGSCIFSWMRELNLAIKATCKVLTVIVTICCMVLTMHF